MDAVAASSSLAATLRGAVIARGAFDGVHLGHRAVLDRVLASAARRGAASAVVVVDEPGARLTSHDHRADLIRAAGVEVVSVAADVAPLDELARDAAPAAIVLGRHDPALAAVQATAAESSVDVEAVAPVSLDGATISTEAVCAALGKGDVDLARRMLGRGHSVRGAVEPGDKRGGAVLGFPTANVAVAGDIVLPADGVYGGSFRRADGSVHRAAISVGRRPTFYDEHGLLLVEAHLLDFDGDLYGERVEVVFDTWVRGQVRFDSIDELIAQMRDDVEVVRAGAA